MLFIEKTSDAMKFMEWLCKITIYVSLLFSSNNDILIASKLSIWTPLIAQVANAYWNWFEMIFNFFNKPTADFRVFLIFYFIKFRWKWHFIKPLKLYFCSILSYLSYSKVPLLFQFFFILNSRFYSQLDPLQKKFWLHIFH